MAADAANSMGAVNFRRRALLITQSQPVPLDRRVWQQAAELAKQGYVVSVISPKNKAFSASYEKLEDIHVFRHPLAFKAKTPMGYLFEYTASLAWEFILTCKVFFSVGFDVIHACNPPDNIFLIGAFFKFFFSKKFISDQRALVPDAYEAKTGYKDLYYKLMRWWERLSFRTADIAIASNDSLRDIAMARGNIPEERIFVVRTGADLERVQKRPTVPSLKNGRKYLVVYSGPVTDQDGIFYLIEAARILVENHQRRDIQFTFAGDGPALKNLKKRVAIDGLADQISFLGFVPDDTILNLLCSADICVSLSEVNAGSEKLSRDNLMEYMTLGRPIVQFDTIEGRFSAGESSCYAKPNDAQDLAEQLLMLLNDSAQRKKMGEAGRGKVETELAWSFEAPKLLAAYDAVFKTIKKH